MQRSNITHTYAMRPIICDCCECRPERLAMERATLEYLRNIPGFGDYDCEETKHEEKDIASAL